METHSEERRFNGVQGCPAISAYSWELEAGGWRIIRIIRIIRSIRLRIEWTVVTWNA